MHLVDLPLSGESKQIYRNNGSIHVGPVSKGTWSITASKRKSGARHGYATKRWTGLEARHIADAINEALIWLL